MNENACVVFSVIDGDMVLTMKLAEDSSNEVITNFIAMVKILIDDNDGMRSLFISQIQTLGKHAPTVFKHIKIPKSKRPAAITPFDVLKGN